MFNIKIPSEIQFAINVIFEQSDQLKPNHKDFDFNYLLAWLTKNDLILSFVAKSEDRFSFPKHFSNSLREEFMNRQNTLFIFQSGIFEIESFFKKIGVAFIPMKGIDFSKRYYPDPYQRFHMDVDIMVQKSDIEFVLEKIRKNPSFKVVSEYSVFDANKQHVQIKMVDFKNFLLEIHYRYIPLNYNCDFESNIKNGSIEKMEKGYSFTHNMNLLLVTASFFTSIDTPFRSFLDAYMILKKEKIDWKAATALAINLGIAKRLTLFLHMLSILVPSLDFPPELVSKSPSFFTRIRSEILLGYCFSQRRYSSIQRLFFRAFMFETFFSFLRYLSRRLAFRMR